MQVKYYDVMKLLFGEDRAAGKTSKTNKMRHNQLEKEREKEKEKEKENVDLNDLADDTYMTDKRANIFDEGQEEPIVDSYSPTYGKSHQSTRTSGSRGIKRKAPMNDFVEAKLDRMTSGIRLMVDALNKGNSIFDQLHDVAKQQIEISARQVAAPERTYTDRSPA